jgi:hypothetical protein
MSIHPWSRIPAGIYHDFHQSWNTQIRDSLNAGVLPADHYALVEQMTLGLEPDVITLQQRSVDSSESDDSSVATMLAPKTRVVSKFAGFNAKKLNRISVRHVSDDRVVAIVELLSPGNKESKRNHRAFLDKVVDFLTKGIHVLLIDVLMPTPRDPYGLHAAVLDELTGEEFRPPMDEQLTFASYKAGIEPTAYMEPASVGGVIPAMPLFLRNNLHVMVPLAEAYQKAYSLVPLRWRNEIEAIGVG